MELTMLLLYANVALAYSAGRILCKDRSGLQLARDTLLTAVSAGVVLFTFLKVDGYDMMTGMWVSLSFWAFWMWLTPSGLATRLQRAVLRLISPR